jgi:hypothetical protein
MPPAFDTQVVNVEHKRTSWAARIKTFTGKLFSSVSAQVKKSYSQLKSRYGPRYSRALLSVAFFTLFLPIPGSWLVGVALIVGIAEVHRGNCPARWICRGGRRSGGSHQSDHTPLGQGPVALATPLKGIAET